MTAKDSRKIAKAIQEGVFIKFTWEEQLRIRQLILDKKIETYEEFIKALEE